MKLLIEAMGADVFVGLVLYCLFMFVLSLLVPYFLYKILLVLEDIKSRTLEGRTFLVEFEEARNQLEKTRRKKVSKPDSMVDVMAAGVISGESESPWRGTGLR